MKWARWYQRLCDDDIHVVSFTQRIMVAAVAEEVVDSTTPARGDGSTA